MPLLTRRDLLRMLGGAAAAIVLVPACGDNTPPAGDPGIFTPAQRAALAAFADVILPPDDEPGGAALGVVAYVERLLTVFDVPGIPPIFGGGPFSGRTMLPGVPTGNDFPNFIELDRVSEASWRLRILGTGAPNEALLGPQASLADQIKAGLDAAGPVDGKSTDELTSLFDGQDDGWKSLMIDLAIEGAFAAPEYGGNLDLAGWRLCNFEGDSAPLGYSQWNGTRHVERADAPLSTANTAADPAPIDGDVDALLKLVVAFLGGRTV